jgi:hypothetical protein
MQSMRGIRSNLWARYDNEARNWVNQFGITDRDMVNAFFHTYVSAAIAQDYGTAASFGAGTSQELYNHYMYRDGGRDPLNDPHQRYDSFRDNWNNDVGRELARIGGANAWNRARLADAARRAVTGGVSISDPYNDPRVPIGLGRFSTIDYLMGNHGPQASDVLAAMPAGTRPVRPPAYGLPGTWPEPFTPIEDGGSQGVPVMPAEARPVRPSTYGLPGTWPQSFTPPEEWGQSGR